MARLVGIDFFFTEASYAEQVADTNALRRARQERDELLDEPDEHEDPVIIIQMEASLRLQSQFEDRLIRRTAKSLNPDGSPLIYLPPLHIQHFYITLTPRELAILECITVLTLEK
jgi:hypothetical protein